MSKKSKETPAESGGTAAKSREQIAAEIAGNSMKPVIGAVVVLIAVGIALMVISSKEDAKKREMAQGYEKLDAVILRQSEMPTYLRTAEPAEKLEAYAGELKALRESGVKSDAVKDALFFEAKISFEQKKYAESADNFTKFYTDYPSRLPLADFARLNAVNAYVNAGTPGDIEKALTIASTVSATDEDIKDKLKYQQALCNVLLGGDDRIKKAKNILEELSAAPAGDEPRMIAGTADSLLKLIERSNPDELKVLATGFPASMVKPTPVEPEKAVPAKVAP